MAESIEIENKFLCDSELVSKPVKCSVCLGKKDCMNMDDPSFRGLNVLAYITKHLDLDLELNSVCLRCWSMLDTFHDFYEMVNKQHQEQQPNSCAVLSDVKMDSSPFKASESERFVHTEFVEIKDEPMEPIKEEEHLSDNSDEIPVSATTNLANDPVEIVSGVQSERKHPRTLRSEPVESVELGSAVALNDPKKKHPKNPKVDQDILEFYKRLVCEICDPEKMQAGEPVVEFSNLKDLNRHMRKSHNQEMGHVKCPMCDKKFRSRVKLLEHKDMHLNPDRFRCNQCNEVHQNMKEHVKNKHQERTYCCEDCGKRFPTKNRLTAHIRKMHTAKDVVCELCQKPFSKYTINDHKRAVHEASFMCELCPRTFKARLPLEQHLEEHKTGVRPAPTATCNICGTVVRDKYSLSSHMKRLHTDHPPVNCGSCGKEFKSKHNLDVHLANVCTDRSFPCTICGKQFKKKIKLTEHMTTHTRSALYQCQYCPKTFSFETQLYTHRKQVHHEQWLELQRRRKQGERFKTKRIAD